MNFSNFYSEYFKYWQLDPEIVFLNHGSFGACPAKILEHQQTFHQQMEQEPVAFVIRELDGLIEKSRQSLADFIGTKPDNLAFVHNVTYGVNTVLKSYPWNVGDEVVISNHIYGACRIALNYIAERYHLKIQEVEIPFPGTTNADITERIVSAVSDSTRMLFIDHITSPTGLLFPIEDIIKALQNKAVDIFIDGAHAPGAVKLDIDSLNVAFYTGNCHKWMCSPKGCGFLYVRQDRQNWIHPLSHSHFSGPARPFHERFHWGGTIDPTPALCLPMLIKFIEDIIPGGWSGMQEYNHQLTIKARKALCDTLEISLPCPDAMITTLAAIPYGISKGSINPGFNEIDELQEKLYKKHHIEVPVYTWPDKRTRIIRPSGQVYNSINQYASLAEILMSEFKQVKLT